MSARLSSRLARLLNLVPYFQAHPGISAAEAARDLGVTPKQIMDDLNQLWVCGLPGYGPGDHRLWPAPAGPGRPSRSPPSPVRTKSGV